MRKLLLIGGGGHCASVADSVLRTNQYDVLGIVDPVAAEPLFGMIPYVGADEDLPRLFATGWNEAFVTLGSIGDVSVRKRLLATLESIGFQVPNIMDPSAAVSSCCSLGKGIYIGKQAVVNARTRIGDAAIINSGTIVEHDCRIGSFVHVATGARLCGGVEVGEDTHIGAGAVIRQYLHIGEHCMIGMGSIVLHDIADGERVAGNPAHNI